METSISARAVAAVVALLLALSACAGAGQAAVEVNGEELSRSELNDLTVALGSDETLIAELGWPRPQAGRYSNEPMATAVTLFVQKVVLADLLDDIGESVTADDREAARETLGAYGDQLVDNLVPLFEPVAAVERLIAEGNTAIDPNDPLGDAVLSADVELDPRYGLWVLGQYLPPGR